LCITPGEEIKIVFVDAYVLDHDGNFMDTAALAAITALHNTELEDFGPLPVSKKPIANTFIKVNGNILLDPSLEEESILDARLTITIEDSGMVCAMQKAGAGAWSKDEVLKCFDIAEKKTPELRKMVEDALKKIQK